MQFHVANRDPVTGRIKPLSSVTAYLTPRRNTCSYHLYHRILLDALLISASPPPLHLLLLQIIVTYLLVDSFRSNFAIRTYFIRRGRNLRNRSIYEYTNLRNYWYYIRYLVRLLLNFSKSFRTLKKKWKKDLKFLRVQLVLKKGKQKLKIFLANFTG